VGLRLGLRFRLLLGRLRLVAHRGARGAVADGRPAVLAPDDLVDQHLAAGVPVALAVGGDRPGVVDEVGRAVDLDHRAVAGAGPALVILEQRIAALLVRAEDRRRAGDAGPV